MVTQYSLIRLGNIASGWETCDTVTKEQMAATDEFDDLMDSGEPFAIVEITFDKGRVAETRDVTNDVIELAAAEIISDKTSDDRMPDWVRDTDAYSDLLEEESIDRKYGTAEQQQRSDYYAGI